MACERFDFSEEACLALLVGFDYRTKITYTVQSTGLPIDLTGSTLTMTVKQNKTDVTPVLSLTNSITQTVSGLYIPTPTSGEFTITVINADTGAITTEGTHLYEISVEDGAGIKTLLLEGNIDITTGVL